MNRWEAGAIEYTDAEKIRQALVGRSIVSTISEGEEYKRVLSFVLDDGTLLKAHATDGGCSCTNGCFSVEPVASVAGTILNVEVKEFEESYGSEAKEITPGSITDGGATIQIFVYTDLAAGGHVLVESEGQDNGYYGWGFWLSVHTPEGASA
ncbi:DUF7448 domain-containing protein [Microbacterium gilvum]|uniref:DUF7448 domain-containing protein n=1 Tax=Microbacterium gilvum TaxID=1336204 RepID=A0ABP8ZR21_9MICO